MPSSKRRADALRALCAEVHPDDGVNPRDDKKRDDGSRNKQNRKLQQLCRQTLHTLQYAWPAVARDAAACLVDVLPAPNAGRLRVVVAVADPVEGEQIAARIEQCACFLRAEVAAGLRRRRSPELVFTIIEKKSEHA